MVFKMERQSLQRKSRKFKQKIEHIIHWLLEKQAEDIVGLDVSGVNAVTEGMIIVSANNIPHAQALADWLLKKFAENKIEFLGMEGYQTGTWILIDCNDLIMHIFQKDYRKFYNLEGLWIEAPKLFG